MVSQSTWIAIVIAAFVVGLGSTYLIFHTGSSGVNENFNMMMQDPSTMRLWMENSQHVEEMAAIMKGNHDFTMEMMFAMIEDPALRLQMIGHLAENPEAMQQMMKMVDSGTQGMMDHGMMNSTQTMNQWMNTMMNEPEMQKMIMTNMLDSNQIQLMEDMMTDMMERMKTDPELKQAMIEHMNRMSMTSENMMDSGMMNP